MANVFQVYQLQKAIYLAGLQYGGAKRRHFYFPSWVIEAADKLKSSLFSYRGFLTAKDSGYSCLMPWHHRDFKTAMDELLDSLPKAPLSLLDGTCNVGMDLIFFMKYFAKSKCRISGCEISAHTYKLLQSNVASFLKTHQNIEKPYLSCDDINAVLERKHYDMVYCDPPWGGQEYKEINPDKLQLKLGDKEISEMIINNWQSSSSSPTTWLIKTPLKKYYNTENLVARVKTAYPDLISKSWLVCDSRVTDKFSYSLTVFRLA